MKDVNLHVCDEHRVYVAKGSESLAISQTFKIIAGRLYLFLK
jgi:hypothetical protein